MRAGQWAWSVAGISIAISGAADFTQAQPANDDCVNALPIFDGPTAFDTTGATTDGQAHAGCQFDTQTYHDIWYQYTSTCSGNLTVSTCNTAAYDSDLVIYDGCDCSGLVFLECNDDASGCSGFTSELTVPVVTGNCYLVRVGGYMTGNQGPGTVNLTCVEPGDGACCHADDFCTYGSMQACVDAGGDFNEGVLCDPDPCLIGGPDVVYNNIGGIQNYGSIGGIRGYALGSHTCNVGDQGLEWTNNGTPGLAMNAYRLYKGRFEQIGMSWVKHACCVSNSACDMTCSSEGIGLRPGCRDVYGAGWNGGQSRLGARSDINPFTGVVPAATGGTGNAIYKRLQIAEAALQQSGLGARYFVEGVYVSTDDAAAGNGLNNASYKDVNVDSGFNLNEIGAMHETVPAIYAWQESDATVEIVNADVPGEGRFVVAAHVGDNGNGTWRYTYAVYNLNSHRSTNSLVVPIANGTTVTRPGFHDVDYHSGEPYDNADWVFAAGAASATWSSTETFAQNPNANALRWGTLYTFWFDANMSPGDGDITLQLFRPGKPDSVTATVRVPVGAGDLPIPTLSWWGLATMTLLLVTAASVVLARRQPVRVA